MKRLYISLLLIQLFSLSAWAQLPGAELRTLNGELVQADTLNNKGKPLVISFFATWCKPCLRELKAVNELYSEWQETTGVRFIAVSIDEGQNSDKVAPLVANSAWDFEVLLDSKNELKRALGVQHIPFVLLLDGKGKTVFQHSGYTDGAELELYEKIKACAAS